MADTTATSAIESPEGDLPPGGDIVAAETRHAAEEFPDRRSLKVAIRMLVIGMLLLSTVRIFILEPYSIPTGSMRSTILEGDVILVNKLPYTIRSLRYIPFTQIRLPYLETPGLGTLERGDVVVFDFPSPPGVISPEGQFVKRCVAVAGDTIRLIDGRIRVNGIEVPPAPGTAGDPVTPGRRVPIVRGRAYDLIRRGNEIVVPYEGYTIEIDSVSAERWRSVIEGEGVSVEYRNRIVFLAGLPATHYVFRRNYFFALGDNSGDSYDSRFFGFIPFDNLIGRAWVVYWSREPDGGVRWNRLGTGVD